MLSLRAISKPTTIRKQYILFYWILARYSWSSDILQPRGNWLPNKRSARKYCDTFLENTISPEGPISTNLCRHDVVEIQPRYNEPTLIVRQCSFEVAVGEPFFCELPFLRLLVSRYEFVVSQWGKGSYRNKFLIRRLIQIFNIACFVLFVTDEAYIFWSESWAYSYHIKPRENYTL